MSPIDKNKQNSSGNTKFVQANKDITTAKKRTREQAFAEMVNALHAPYNSGDKFFRIFKEKIATIQVYDWHEKSIKSIQNSIKQ